MNNTNIETAIIEAARNSGDPVLWHAGAAVRMARSARLAGNLVDARRYLAVAYEDLGDHETARSLAR